MMKKATLAKPPAKTKKATRAAKTASPRVADEAQIASKATKTAPSDRYNLVQQHQRLGAADPQAKAALAASHSRDELLEEGREVASGRILDDGTRLGSHALVLLESGDAKVLATAAEAGLTRHTLALTVE